MIAWTRVHAIVAVRGEIRRSPRVHVASKVKPCGNIVPHGRKNKTGKFKLGGSITLSRYRPQQLTRVPLFPWALHLPACHMAPHTGAHVDPSAWHPATQKRHLRLARATCALPRGLSATSHLEVVPRATSAFARHVSFCSPHQRVG